MYSVVFMKDINLLSNLSLYDPSGWGTCTYYGLETGFVAHWELICNPPQLQISSRTDKIRSIVHLVELAISYLISTRSCC